ncbi:MAG: sigma D regulator [Pseudomonadota bacterium]|nr:Rsd/AlgQ family anti-sigma factor [Gammaproteobacteria bacterium]MDQ3583469.1 sigma D regulator [Pseudomonadota bacterium]
MGNLNMKYAMDRRATQGLVAKLLTERDQVLARMCRFSGVPPFDHDAVLVTEFCELLTDYVAAAHFGLYERERRRLVRELAAALCPDIAATTELALEFSDKYCAGRAHGGYVDLHGDLARLGEVLARRIKMEDRVIGALGSVPTVQG